jgi:hypothetical protein
MTALDREDVPVARRQLLVGVLGQQVDRLVRYSWWPPVQAMRECQVPPEAVFGRTAGPLLVGFANGTVVGFASQPALVSVTLWSERVPGGLPGELEHDGDLYPIDGCDPVYARASFRRIVGRRLTAVNVLYRLSSSVRMSSQPCQAGVVLTVDDGSELLLVHGLHDDSDDFAVIDRQEIHQAVAAQLREVRL